VSKLVTTSIDGLLLEEPFHAFWTAYDPLDLASGSLDPLGFARGYLALADRFLPSFTTVTDIPRYVSMLCATLRKVQIHYGNNSRIVSSKDRQERLKLVKSFERAWALSCGLASKDPRFGKDATKGLRGIRYVNQRIETLNGRGKSIQTGSFNLLSNQVRYGGIGIYSTFLEECHLASMQSFTLRPLGEALADAFPLPLPDLPIHDEDANLSLETLKKWGEHSHVGAFSKKEGKILAEALRGGEEAEFLDHVRWATLRMLAKCDTKPGYDEGELLRRLTIDLSSEKHNKLKVPPDCLSQISATLQILEPFEQFYQGLIFLFEQILGAASDEIETSLPDLARQGPVKDAYTAITKVATNLQQVLKIAHEVNPKTAGEVESVLRESGILLLVDNILLQPADAAESLRIVVRRHAMVQSSKFDNGSPKAAWTRLMENGKVRLTAQRHQLLRSQRPEDWKDVKRHSYRTKCAFSFIEACGIE
jgi:hypothetical protein